jgi:hypothetical protein
VSTDALIVGILGPAGRRIGSNPGDFARVRHQHRIVAAGLVGLLLLLPPFALLLIAVLIRTEALLMWFDELQTAAGADVQSSTTCLRNMGAKGYAKNQIPGQIDRNRLASDSQAAAGRQQPASLARDEHG